MWYLQKQDLLLMKAKQKQEVMAFVLVGCFFIKYEPLSHMIIDFLAYVLSFSFRVGLCICSGFVMLIIDVFVL